jgi:hypothetical protein
VYLSLRPGFKQGWSVMVVGDKDGMVDMLGRVGGLFLKEEIIYFRKILFNRSFSNFYL